MSPSPQFVKDAAAISEGFCPKSHYHPGGRATRLTVDGLCADCELHWALIPADEDGTQMIRWSTPDRWRAGCTDRSVS